jgi:acyl-CoA synthetase (AMP-forming)/AMP-acid ligase II
VDQPLLDRLRNAYPAARIVHIYATTELGRCFAVNDGLAGFPASYLNAVLPEGTELRIEDGELQVRSLNSMRMYDPLSPQPLPRSDWFPTSDLVAINVDRVHFIGRKSEMINVAGSKVFPVEVERVLWTIPGISDVRVYGKASSLAGELVACEIVPDAGQNVEVLKATVVQTCRAKLASPQQPRLIKFVDRLDLSPAGKILRNKVS